MNRHYTKTDFGGIAFMVIVFEVLAGISLLFGGFGALYMMTNVALGDNSAFLLYIMLAFGGIAAAFLFFAFAEFLQLLMKIEVNTRHLEKLFEKAAKSTTTATKTTARKKRGRPAKK